MLKKQSILTILLAGILLLIGCAITPKPFTIQEIEERAKKDAEAMFSEQEPIKGPVSLYEAMARAIKYNLDNRLKLMEEALANRQLDVARYDMLPELTASAGYNRRNNDQGSSSVALTGPSAGVESLVNSTSRERIVRTRDIAVMWNVLDFGVSYVRAQQQADQMLIVEERRRKVIQNIIQDVRYAYWRAASAELLIEQMMDLLDRSRSALDRSFAINGQRLQAPRATLEYQKNLLENCRLLWSLIQKLEPAKKELASLININPGQPFQIAQPDWDSTHVPSVNIAVDDLEHMAMIYRPELREIDYKDRISTLQVRNAILGMLPGIDLKFGYNYDSNKYLYNETWSEAGASIALNIFNGLLSGPAAIRAAKSQKELEVIRRQAMSMAVVTQVHLAYQRHHLLREEYFVSKQLNEINQKLKEQTAMERSAGRGDEMTEIRDATNALLATMRDHLAYASLQDATGRLYNSAGLDILPEEVESLDLATLAMEFERSFVSLERMFDAETVESSDKKAVPAVTEQEVIAEEVALDANRYEAGNESILKPDRVQVKEDKVVEAESIAVIKKEPESNSIEAVQVTSSLEDTVNDDILKEEIPEDNSIKTDSAVEEISNMPPAEPGASINASRVNIRQGPSLKDIVLCRVVNKDTAVVLLDQAEGSWVKVRIGECNGWVHKRYIDLQE